jgi:hypothetical protein
MQPDTRYAKSGNVRRADVAERGLGRLNWAEPGPTRVVSGRTGIRAIAAVL